MSADTIDQDIDAILAGAEAAMRRRIWLHVDPDGPCFRVFTANPPEWVEVTRESLAAAIKEWQP